MKNPTIVKLSRPLGLVGPGLAAALAALTLVATPAQAQLLVYEGFQYGIAGASRAGSDLLHGQPDGSGGDTDATGLGGTWQDSTTVTSTTDMFMAAGSLSFGDLATSGNHVRSDTNLNNDTFSRPITVNLASGTELWFSVLANKLQNNNSAAEGGLVIGNQSVNNSRILLDTGSTGLAGFGVAPTTAGNDWTAYAWNGSSQSVGDAALTVPTNGTVVRLLVGHISFDTGAGGTDQFTLYDYQLNAGSVVGGTLNAIASTIEVDVDQSTLGILSLSRQVNTAYDEIRIGATLDDVLGLGADTTAPVLASTNPADEASDVVVSTNLVATFSEEVALTGTGTVTLRNLTAGPGSDVTISLPNGQVTVSATDLTINPSSDLDLNTDYAVRISADAVVDTAGSPNAFAGIADDTTWNFKTVADGTAPTLASTNPADEATGVAPAANLVATFDENIALGSGTITIKNLTDATQIVLTLPDAQVSVSGTDLTIDLTGLLLAGKNYAIRIDPGAVTDLIGNPFAGISNDTDWNFITAPDTIAPVIISTAPADDATGVAPAANLVATFDEPVALGTGTITIKNLTDATQLVITLPDAQVSVAGTDLTINPTSLLADGKEHAVQISSTAVEDLAGNPFAGILNDSAWTFTTATPPSGLLVYEGFQYADPATSDGLHGQPDDPGLTDTDATGLTGTWADATGISTGNLFLKPGSLPFGDLATSGNHVGSNTNANNDIFHRDLTAAARDGVGGNPEIWFSFLADKPQNNFSAAQGGLALTNQVLGNSRVYQNDGSDGLAGFGVAPTSAGNNWTAYAWDGSSQVAGDAALPVAIGAGEVHLLVGKISFDTGTGGTDQYTLYDYQLNGGSITGGTLNQIATTLEVDLDQSTIDVLNLTRQVNTNYDEIRIGTTLEDVLPGGGGGPGDYDTWAAGYPGSDLTDPDADLDQDGLTNDEERLFGLHPADPSSVNPFAAPLQPAGGTFSFTRRDDALTGKFADIETSTDLQTWTVDNGAVLNAGAPDGNNIETVQVTLSAALLSAPQLFVRVVQRDGTTPLSENFETDDGGFTVATTAGSDWQFGDPDSGGLGGAVTTGNGASTNCWGTNIGNPGFYASVDPVTTVTCLRSTVIDLTGIAAAELIFAEALDLEAGDTAAVNIIDDTSDTVISAAIYTATDASTNSANWAAANGGTPISIPPAALGQLVRVEWCFTGTGGTTDDYMGWYIDDVTVQEILP